MATGETNDYVQEGTKGLLFIEPSQPPSKEPLVDQATRKMAAAFAQAKMPDFGYRGFHVCSCGAPSSNKDYIIDGKFTTNSLCVHYLAFHRSEVPESELKKVESLAQGEAIPSDDRLGIPKPPRPKASSVNPGSALRSLVRTLNQDHKDQ